MLPSIRQAHYHTGRLAWLQRGNVPLQSEIHVTGLVLASRGDCIVELTVYDVLVQRWSGGALSISKRSGSRVPDHHVGRCSVQAVVSTVGVYFSNELHRLRGRGFRIGQVERNQQLRGPARA